MIDFKKFPKLVDIVEETDITVQKLLVLDLTDEELEELLRDNSSKIALFHLNVIYGRFEETKRIELLDKYASNYKNYKICPVIADFENEKLKKDLIIKYKQKIISRDMVRLILSMKDQNLRIEIIKACALEIRLYDIIGEGISRFDEDKVAQEELMAYFEIIFKGKEYKENHKIKSLGLPKEMTIGIELEFDNLNFVLLEKLRKKQYFDSVILKCLKIPKNVRKGLKSWISKEEILLIDGAEVNSPILKDTLQSWQELDVMCYTLKLLGAEVECSCGGHIHFGSKYLGYDDKTWRIFLLMWEKVENIFYKICNAEGITMRNGALKHARAIANNISNIENEILSVKIKSEDDLKNLMKQLDVGESKKGKFASLNLSNIIEPRHKKDDGTIEVKETVEFRMANGSLESREIMHNVYLYGKYLEFAKKKAKDEKYKDNIFKKLFKETDEEQKLLLLLDLLFDTVEEKEVYIRRWKMLPQNPIYEELENSKN